MSQSKPQFPTLYFTGTLVLSCVLASLFGFTAGMIAGNGPTTDALLAVLPGSLRHEVTANKPVIQVVSEESATIAAVKKATPAVVSIVITKDVPQYEQYFVNPTPNNDFFNQFFGNDFPQMQVPQYRQKGTEKQQVGAGSGFIVSPDGYMVTNRHVVADEEADYTAILTDGRKLPVKVLARDTANDIAVLKIEGKDLPTIELGDSGSLQVGQRVIAIGYALGEFGNTVSTGVVSGLARSLRGVSDGTARNAEDLFGVIQTDAAINPGNSGGPLLNLQAQAIGINVAIVQGSQNIGFALPINDIKKVVDSVKKTGKIARPFLGVRYMIINKELKDKEQLSVDYGALVARGTEQTDLAVTPGSPADKAGLVENVIILEVNGTMVAEEMPLAQMLQKYAPGEVIHLKILHKGEEKKVDVTLAERK